LNQFGKVLVLGLDGATFDVIDPLMARGELPNLERLVREGCGLELRSTIHQYSAQAWSSFMTGMNAGKHGILDFTEHVKSEYRLKFLNASHREGQSLWRILSDCGKRVGVVNLPFTYPPERVNGFIVSGMDAPSINSDYTYPKELKDELAAETGEYIIELGVKDYIAKGHPEDFLEEMEHAFKSQMKAMEYLVKNKPWDVFVYVYRLTDQVQHYFWKYFDQSHPCYDEKADEKLKNAIPWVYKEIDKAIGDLMAWLGDDVSVVVMSDHGQGGINGKKVFLNRWLSSQGFLRFCNKTAAPRCRVLNNIFRNSRVGLIDLIRRNVPKAVRTAVVKRAPWLKDKLVSHGVFSNIDWEKTRAYSDEKRANIWINVRECQLKGVVTPGEEYENLRDEIIAKIGEMRDPETQEPIFSEIYKKEDLYWGPHLEKAPDILLTQGKRKYSYVLQRSDKGGNTSLWIEDMSPEELRKRTNANHREEGILIIKANNIKKMGRLSVSAHIMDVAPTILHMMGLPIPEEMDGKVLVDLFVEEYLADHEVIYASLQDNQRKERIEYSAEEEALISERLKGLGYL
jgi:predicted AlkP superfamily phosphohydrolase/phosphomutase